jgi:hypothetical protein
MSGGNGRHGDDWDAFDWASWGRESPDDGDGKANRRHDELAYLSGAGNGRLTEADEESSGPSGGSGGAWVSQGGILRWEGADEEDETVGIRAEAASRWAADDVDLPPGAPDSLRIRSARAWLARQRQLEAEAVGLLLMERRKLAGAEARSEDADRGGPASTSEESPLDLALAEHTAAMQEYERLLELLWETAEHSGPARLLVELYLALTERLAELATSPEAPAGFSARVLLAEVEDEETTSQGTAAPTPRSTAEWEGQAQAVLLARKRVEFVSAPEPED